MMRKRTKKLCTFIASLALVCPLALGSISSVSNTNISHPSITAHASSRNTAIRNCLKDLGHRQWQLRNAKRHGWYHWAKTVQGMIQTDETKLSYLENHRTASRRAPSTGYYDGHWYQNGHRLYSYYPFDDTPISQYRTMRNNGRNTTTMPKFHEVAGFYNGDYGRYAQSINMTKSGNYAFIAFDSHYSGYVRLIRINLSSGYIKVGPWFYGGHGQAVAYNPKTNRIWCLARTNNGRGDSNQGPLDHGEYVEVNAGTLRPIYREPFDMQGEYLGDNLAFDYGGNALNAEKVYYYSMEHKQFPWGSSIFYKGEISEHGSEWQRLHGILHSGGMICQGIAYNPLNGKIYEQSSKYSNNIISVDANKLKNNTAKTKDIHKMRMRDQYREPEGMSFDSDGYAYTIMTSPYSGYTRVMKSNTPFGSNR